MKIVHVFWGLTYGGIETMLVNIANEQVKLGAEVYVMVINGNTEEGLIRKLNKHVHFICLGREQKSRNFSFIFKYNKLLFDINPHVIHLHGSQFYSILLSHKLRRITCVTLHDLPLGLTRRSGLFSFLPEISNFCIIGNVTCIDKIPRVFAISKSVKKELKDKYGVDSTIVYNGIRTNDFLPRANTAHGDVLKIIMVSRVEHDKKGQDLLIEAAAMLRGVVDVSFIGIGSSMEFLKDLTTKLGVDEYVHFCGKKTQDYIANHLKDYDLFCQPSRWEGFGLTVAEAMAANLPVLVSTGQGPAEVTQDEKYGWTFENGNVDDLVCKIKFICNNYRKALEKSNRAKEFVKDNYDVAVTAKRYLELYKK